MSQSIDADELDRALARRDLSDPEGGAHAVQLVVAALERAASASLRAAQRAESDGVPVRRDPGPRIVTVADNYDRLRFSAAAATRDARYSRYLGDGRMLRSHTTARVPALLDEYARAGAPRELLLSLPGICYRRDVIDRHHVGEPHQMDLWRLRRDGPPLGEDDLVEMIRRAVTAVLPDRRWWTVPNEHPYTLAGREIYVAGGDGDVEIGECGLAHPEVLRAAGLSASASGLAMGLGLDRLLMLAKGVDDIRLLRSADPRVAAQMLDLEPYRPVSAMPPVRRDMSLAVGADRDAELLGDRVRVLLGSDADMVEEVTVLSETAYADLPHAARERMGLRAGQKNVLLRVVLRDLTRTLSAAQANALRDRIYDGLHEGSAHEWTLSRGASAHTSRANRDDATAPIAVGVGQVDDGATVALAHRGRDVALAPLVRVEPRLDDHHAPRARVGGETRDRRPQLLVRLDVADRAEQAEHGVEGAAEIERAHVAGVDGDAGHLRLGPSPHRRRQLDARDVSVAVLQVQQVLAGAAGHVENAVGVGRTVSDQLDQGGRLGRVVLAGDRVDQVVDLGVPLVVHAMRGYPSCRSSTRIGDGVVPDDRRW